MQFGFMIKSSSMLIYFSSIKLLNLTENLKAAYTAVYENGSDKFSIWCFLGQDQSQGQCGSLKFIIVYHNAICQTLILLFIT